MRTNYGKIDKVINDDYYMSLYLECENGLVEISNIVKHSKDIIDLIEDGDYVNGYRVIDIQAGYLYIDKTNPSTELCETLVDYQIKSILTKEQMSSIEYKV